MLTTTLQPRLDYYASLDGYWEIMDAMKPDWRFDFISIHENSMRHETPVYTLISPLSLCRIGASCRRPRFERKQFDSHADARRHAERIIRNVSSQITIHIVNTVR